MEKLSIQETGDHKNTNNINTSTASSSCRTDEKPCSNTSQRFLTLKYPHENKPLMISTNLELRSVAFASIRQRCPDLVRGKRKIFQEGFQPNRRIRISTMEILSNQETGDHKNTNNASTSTNSCRTDEKPCSSTSQPNKPLIISNNSSELKLASASIQQRGQELVTGKRKIIFEEGFQQNLRTRMSHLLKIKEEERFEQGLEWCKFVLCFLDTTDRSERNRVTANIGAMRNYSHEEEEEEKRLGVSTKLRLDTNPFKIKKVLTKSDTGNLCRLLLSDKIMRDDVFPTWRPEDEAQVTDHEAGKRVTIWDQDTRSEYTLLLKRWKNWKSFIMIDNWKRDFVNRRALKERDEIGLYWDPYNNRFTFSLLQQAPPLPQP